MGGAEPATGSLFPGSVAALILGAGASQRMGGLDKVFAQVAGKPLLAHSIEVFQECPSIDEIVLVLSEANLGLGRRLAEEEGWSKLRQICCGGPRRQDSVWEGLKLLGGFSWVVIHDGARPLVTQDLIQQGLEAAYQSGAAIAAVPVVDTIKAVDAEGMVERTLSRNRLWAAQTPQVFRLDLIKEAYRQAKEEFTDDAALLERLGHSVRVYMGSYQNLKVTTPEDLALAEALLEMRTQGRGKIPRPG